VEAVNPLDRVSVFIGHTRQLIRDVDLLDDQDLAVRPDLADDFAGEASS